MPKFTHVLIGFCLYFGVQLVLTPLLAQLKLPDALWGHYSALIALSVAAISLVAYVQRLKQRFGVSIWSLSNAYSPFKSFLYGVCCYPITLLLSSLLVFFLHLLLPDLRFLPEIDQLSVKQLKESAATPPLFTAMLFSVLLVAPLSEELLFRGLFQRMLQRYLPTLSAITLTSIFFAILHCSNSQGLRNIEIVAVLFCLSFVQGYLYETTKKLAAPLGLHIAFNSATVAMLFFSDAF